MRSLFSSRAENGRNTLVRRIALWCAIAMATTTAWAVTGGVAAADSAPADPNDPSTPTTVSADGLPTAQINGVVWSQTVVNDIVYAGGNLQQARPAGAAAGTNETPRGNLLAYDINTGTLTSFAPMFNGQVRSVALRRTRPGCTSAASSLRRRADPQPDRRLRPPTGHSSPRSRRRSTTTSTPS